MTVLWIGDADWGKVFKVDTDNPTVTLDSVEPFGWATLHGVTMTSETDMWIGESIDHTNTLVHMLIDGTTVDYVESWTSSFFGDLAFDGTNILVANNGQARIDFIDPSTYSFISSLDLSGICEPTGLTYRDGEYWVVDAYGGVNKNLIRLDSSGTPLQSFTGPWSEPIGLHHDGTHLWMTDAWLVRLYKIDPSDGTVLEDIDISSWSFGPTGITEPYVDSGPPTQLIDVRKWVWNLKSITLNYDGGLTSTALVSKAFPYVAQIEVPLESYIWVAGDNLTIYRIEIGSWTVDQSFTYPGSDSPSYISDMGFHDGNLWTISNPHSKVCQIDTSGVLQNEFNTDDFNNFNAIGWRNGELWVGADSSSADGLYKYDPVTGAQLDFIPEGEFLGSYSTMDWSGSNWWLNGGPQVASHSPFEWITDYHADYNDDYFIGNEGLTYHNGEIWHIARSVAGGGQGVLRMGLDGSFIEFREFPGGMSGWIYSITSNSTP